jgi:Matrixin
MKIERLVLGLALAAAGVSGSSSLSTTALSGLHVNSLAAVASGSGSDGEILSKCTDGAYTKNGHRWSSRLYWYFQSGSRPKGSDASRVAAALARAASNITTGHNNCNLADAISATQTYQGGTSRAPNISKYGGCLGRDGRNVVGFGTLPRGVLGMTCWWTYGGRTVETDIKLNKAYYAWFIIRRSDCRGKWSIEGVATHEFGHAFGLGHVSPDYHSALTMSPVIRACQSAQRWLGLGDILGLRSLY